MDEDQTERTKRIDQMRSIFARLLALTGSTPPRTDHDLCDSGDHCCGTEIRFWSNMFGPLAGRELALRDPISGEVG